MSQWVQHISGQGEKWPVESEDSYGYQVDKGDKRCGFGVAYDLPKSEYRLCDPPERWVDVTEGCEVSNYGDYITHQGKVIFMNTGYRLVKKQLWTSTKEQPEAFQVWAFTVEKRG